MSRKRLLVLAGCVVVLATAGLFWLVFQQNQEAAQGSDCEVCDTPPVKDKPIEAIRNLTLASSISPLPSGQQQEVEAARDAFAQALSERIGIPVENLTLSNDEDVQKALHDKKADVVFLLPFSMIRAQQQLVADPLLQTESNGRASKRSEYVVADASPLLSISDLVKSQQVRWAFDAKGSDTGFLLPGAQLTALGIADLDRHFQLQQVRNFQTAVAAVLDGKADVATVQDDSRLAMQSSFPGIFERTRVIGYTPAIPLKMMGIRPGIQDAWKQKVKEALLDLAEEPAAKKQLEEGFGCSGLTEIQTQQYEAARKTLESAPQLLQREK